MFYLISLFNNTIDSIINFTIKGFTTSFDSGLFLLAVVIEIYGILAYDLIVKKGIQKKINNYMKKSTLTKIRKEIIIKFILLNIFCIITSFTMITFIYLGNKSDEEFLRKVVFYGNMGYLVFLSTVYICNSIEYYISYKRNKYTEGLEKYKNNLHFPLLKIEEE